VTEPPPPPPERAAEAPPPPAWGCAAALDYLRAHAAPDFELECPGWAAGHQAITCIRVAGVCPGRKVIAISVPCPAAYMNEAYNSNLWSDAEGRFTGAIDPYGHC
jgi:hypothetical protein